MADRRCFHRKVTEGDPFYSLPPSAQALYLHLVMSADDDGFVNSARSVASRFKTGNSDLRKLVDQRYLLRFDEIYVIRHWRVSNSLKNDRTKPPAYPQIAGKIWIDANREYEDSPVDGCSTLLDRKNGFQNGFQNGFKNGFRMDSQRNRTEQNRTEPNRTEPNRSVGRGNLMLEIFDAYPEKRRGSMAEAEEVFGKSVWSEDDLRTAYRNLEAWKLSEQWTKENGRFIPFLRNWIERGEWKIQPDKQTQVRRELDEYEIEAIRRLMEEEP